MGMSCAADGRKGKAPGKGKEGEGEVELLQGLVRNYRKLQGPVCKIKFPVDLKPK
jgi:hypothetical protein